MHFSGISSHPLGWKRLLWSARLFFLITTVEGLATLLWFVANPSEPGSRVFLLYSSRKWALILGTTAVLLVLGFFLWVIRFRTNQIEHILKLFEHPHQTRRLVLFATLLFVIATGLVIWLLRSEGPRSSVAGMFPLLLWGFAAVVQGWIFLAAASWPAALEAFQDSFPVSREKQVYSLTVKDKYLLLGLSGLSLVYLLFIVKSYLDVREAALIGDSWSYLYGAGLGLNDPAFFSERRPWAILLIFKILGSSQAAIALFQLSVSAFAWLWLAWTFIRSVQNGWMKLVGFCLTLGLGLTPAVQLWNHTVLSESLSISLMVLMIAVFLRLAQQWKWYHLFSLILLFLFWMSIREANAYVAVFVASALFLAGLARRRMRATWLLSFFITLIFLFNHQLSSGYALPRWALPLAEVITHRILPEREYLEYFSANGMPVNSELMELSGRNANSNDYAVINSPALKKFTRWLFNNSRDVYLKFLITHPVYTLWSPLAEIQTLLGYNYLEGYIIPEYVPALPALANELFYPLRWFWGYLALSLIFLGAVFVTGWRSSNRAYWWMAGFFLLSIPHLYLVWHGDALDVERHAVLASIQFHLGGWSLLVLYLDKVIANRAFH